LRATAVAPKRRFGALWEDQYRTRKRAARELPGGKRKRSQLPQPFWRKGCTCILWIVKIKMS
jgi:hypothetical protein